MTHHAKPGTRTRHLTHKAERELFAADPHVKAANLRYDTRDQLPTGWDPAAPGRTAEEIWAHHRRIEAIRTTADFVSSNFLIT